MFKCTLVSSGQCIQLPVYKPVTYNVDGEFPIDLSQIQVERDHRFLDEAAIESLLRYDSIHLNIFMYLVLFFRRLRVLNQCADLFLARVTKYSKVTFFQVLFDTLSTVL